MQRPGENAMGRGEAAAAQDLATSPGRGKGGSLLQVAEAAPGNGCAAPALWGVSRLLRGSPVTLLQGGGRRPTEGNGRSASPWALGQEHRGQGMRAAVPCKCHQNSPLLLGWKWPHPAPATRQVTGPKVTAAGSLGGEEGTGIREDGEVAVDSSLGVRQDQGHGA